MKKAVAETSVAIPRTFFTTCAIVVILQVSCRYDRDIWGLFRPYHIFRRICDLQVSHSFVPHACVFSVSRVTLSRRAYLREYRRTGRDRGIRHRPAVANPGYDNGDGACGPART